MSEVLNGSHRGVRLASHGAVMVASLLVNGLGVALMRLASLGTEPFTCLNYSVAEGLGLPLAVPMIAISAVLLAMSAVFLRSAIGFGTAANVILLGVFADLWQGWLAGMGVDAATLVTGDYLFQRLALMLAGMALMVIGSAFYMSADLGMSPYDALGYVVERLTGGRVTFRWARMAADACCVTVAFAVASAQGTEWELVGIGTLVMVFGIGPLLSWLIGHVARPAYAALDRTLGVS